MGLSMAQKQAVTNQVARRYRKANKREKKRILDEFCATTGYHRKYAMQLLNRWGTSELHRIDGTLVKIVVGKPRKRAKRIYQRIYDEPVHKALRDVWDLF